MSADGHQVLIVGAGPVGLTCAIELARYGVAVRIVDKALERSDKSKALAIWSRTLEVLHRGGVTAALVAAGHKVRATRFTSGSKELGRVSFDNVASPFNYVLLIPQDETERILESHLNALGVRIERGVELTTFEQTATAVTVTLARADGGGETASVPWLVACDGAHSPVRHALGMVFAGTTQPAEFVLADVHLAGSSLAPEEMGMYAHPDGALALFPIRGDRFRVIADVNPPHADVRPDPTLEDLQRLLDRRLPGTVRAFDPVWLTTFRVNERKVADYRSGRVFLAGDAAHVHSPAGGQGMNTGMQDACNLAWKLALVARGTSSVETLLTSYSEERSPVARAVIEETGRLQTLMTIRNPALQAARNAIASVIFGFAPARRRLATTLSEISIDYPKSPLTRAASHASGSPSPGERAPIRAAESPVGSGSEPRFALYADAFPGWDDLATSFRDVLEPTLRVPFHASDMHLVRPDGYVATVARDVSAIRAYLETVA